MCQLLAMALIAFESFQSQNVVEAVNLDNSVSCYKKKCVCTEHKWHSRVHADCYASSGLEVTAYCVFIASILI